MGHDCPFPWLDQQRNGILCWQYDYQVPPNCLPVWGNTNWSWTRNKCIFGASHEKLLGFIISRKGVEVDPSKAKGIIGMPTPHTEKDVHSFLGHIQYISRFIAQLTPIYEPLFKQLRKNVPIQWNNDCQDAFDKIKMYLLSPPILISPKPNRLLILYLTIHDSSMECMLGHHDKTGKKE